MGTVAHVCSWPKEQPAIIYNCCYLATYEGAPSITSNT